MLDLETIAVTPRAAVLTLGAVTFNPFTDKIYDELYLKFDLDDQDVLGREVDTNTLDWWAKQDPAIMEEAFSPDNRVPLAEAIDQFHKFAWGCKSFWSHGSTFDIVIMEDIYKQLNRAVPWSFWEIRDTRTLFSLGAEPEMPTIEKHNALQDAIRQAVGVQNVYSKLKIKSKY
jgi:exodeoxyribonuclease VIII